LTTARIMKMGARSRYANRADVSVSVAITQRGVTGFSGLSLAPLVGTRRSVDDHAHPYSRGGRGAVCLAGLHAVPPMPLAINPKPFQRFSILFSRETSIRI